MVPAVFLASILAACQTSTPTSIASIDEGDNNTSSKDDNIAPAAVTVAGASVREGDSGTKKLTFTISLDTSSSRDVSIDYATKDSTASAGSDYKTSRGTARIPSGSTSTTVDVTILGDTEVESDETVELTLSNPRNATLKTASALGSILNDDTAQAAITVAAASVSEGDSGTKKLTFTISLDASSSRDVSIDYATQDNTASAGSDYEINSGTARIPSGSTSTTVDVTILGDTEVESDETVELTLSNPRNATLKTATALGSILNDDVFTTTDSCIHTGTGTDYPVGPGQPYRTLADVPWPSLGAGDTVRIFWRDTPYREKILISTSGSEQQPIRICGVPNANGERPIISGKNATTPANLKTTFGTWLEMQIYGLIIIWDHDYDFKPANIVIEGLHLQHARNEYRFTNSAGSNLRYGNGAACIRVQAADNVVIRNNELENCSNGIFTMSQEYNEASLTRNILIEGNYLHDNGQPGSYREHSMYIQAIGATYQYNRFGPNIPGALGTTLKERVAGSVIRYNWFDSGSSRSLDLVEVEDAAPWYIEQAYRDWAADNGEAIDPARLQKVKNAEKAYRKTYVYGNFFRHVGSKTEAGDLVHYGYDNDPEYARRGTLYFYNNTVSILNDLDDDWRIRLFDVRLYDENASTPAEETIEVFNNIIYFASETPGATPSNFCLSRESGTINLGKNWITDSWKNPAAKTECYPYVNEQPTVNGAEKLIDTSGAPAPIDVKTLVPNDITTIRNQIQSLPATVNNGHRVSRQYVPDQDSISRPVMSTPGAMELP